MTDVRAFWGICVVFTEAIRRNILCSPIKQNQKLKNGFMHLSHFIPNPVISAPNFHKQIVCISFINLIFLIPPSRHG